MKESQMNKDDCKCKVVDPTFNPDVTSKHESECSAGGGYAQWIEHKCDLCGREWEENFGL